MCKTLADAIKATLGNIAKEPASLIDSNVEMLTVHMRMTEMGPNRIEGECYGIATTVIAESIERLGALIKELKDPKNCPTITRMISEIFKEHGEEMLFGRHKAKITVTVTNSQHLPIIKYTKILIGGYVFTEDDEYAEKEI